MLIYENDYIQLLEEQTKVYIQVNKEGFSLKDFDMILKKNPRIKLTSFANLRKALNTVGSEQVEIGAWLLPLEIVVSRDRMLATMYINEDPTTIFQDDDNLNKQIREVAENVGVTFGLHTLSLNDVKSGKPVTVAAGLPPQKGSDAKITYLEIPERKPQILESGRADYYDMNFIFEIEQDAWLGEKIPAKPGIPGKNVLGETIPAIDGKDIPLKYDASSIYEQEVDGKIIIRAKNNGVIDNTNEKLAINKHLQIKKDVGLETGNLKFDGSITISETVVAGFSVEATGDISIEGIEGVTGAKLIESKYGDIYIRGGIFGNGESVVRAGGNIYVKHTNDSTLQASKDIFIGSYSMGSNLKAQNIFVNEQSGKIIGGSAEATNSINAAISGNRLERKTELILTLPDRKESAKIIKDKKDKIMEIEKEIAHLDEKVFSLKPFLEQMNEIQRKTYDDTIETIHKKESELNQLETEINSIFQQLKSTGDENINITKEAFPGTVIQIGKKSTILNSSTCGKFTLENGELNV